MFRLSSIVRSSANATKTEGTTETFGEITLPVKQNGPATQMMPLIMGFLRNSNASIRIILLSQMMHHRMHLFRKQKLGFERFQDMTFSRRCNGWKTPCFSRLMQKKWRREWRRERKPWRRKWIPKKCLNLGLC